MLINIYNIAGLIAFSWYIGYRWTSLGNILGKTINGNFLLNWWFAPINFITAITTLVFVTIALFDFDYSFKIRALYWVAALLLGRNAWYTVIDIIDYINDQSIKQFSYIVVDIVMVIFTWIWIHIFRSMS
jgi:hypothetical protein